MDSMWKNIQELPFSFVRTSKKCVWLLAFVGATITVVNLVWWNLPFDTFVVRKNATQHNKTNPVLIVSAYFDLGSFQKGLRETVHAGTYFKWAEAFGWIRNPMLIYTDSLSFEKHLKIIRRNHSARTEVVLIRNRTELPSFQYRDAIEMIYRQPGYPKHHPNTILADYSCCQHAKYDLMSRTIKQNLFHGDYYAWLDIGYFRDMVQANNTDVHEICIPLNFTTSRVGYNLVYKQDMRVKPEQIIRRNSVWVGGGFFIGRKDVILEFVTQYHRAFRYLLENNLMSTDQQVIYSMYTETGRKAVRPEVELQLFKQPPRHSGNQWFYLGYLCLHKTRCPEQTSPVKRTPV